MNIIVQRTTLVQYVGRCLFVFLCFWRAGVTYWCALRRNTSSCFPFHLPGATNRFLFFYCGSCLCYGFLISSQWHQMAFYLNVESDQDIPACISFSATFLTDRCAALHHYTYLLYYGRYSNTWNAPPAESSHVHWRNPHCLNLITACFFNLLCNCSL